MLICIIYETYNKNKGREISKKKQKLENSQKIDQEDKH